MSNELMAISLLDEASEVVREEAGLEQRTPDLGGEGVHAIDERMFALADRLQASQPELPPLPKTGALPTLLIVIFVAALLFIATVVLARDQDVLPALLVGQGTIFTALTGVAAYLATTHSVAVKAYNERAGEWMRTDAVIRILREMSRGRELSPERMLALLDSLKAAFPSQTS
ncbi:MAG: hypothetical protein AAFR21_11665 [Pseudomonadota bacterium]